VTPQALQDRSPFALAEDATYLITGGLGGFGLAVARWMVDSGARHVVLMGRRPASMPAREAIAEMERHGATVVIAQADVTKEREVAEILADIRRSMPPLRGVVHAAMVLDDDLLIRLDGERFRRVMAPKVLGAWNLHCETRHTPLDFFVMFSSTSSLLGSPGQANYAAANAFLDALTHQRRAEGLPSLTVNWGRLGDVGYVVEHPELEEYFSRLGMQALPVEQATHMLGRLLRAQTVQATAAKVDWGKLGQQFMTAKRSPRFAHLVHECADAVDQTSGSTRETILAARDDERQRLLESHLRETVARVLGTTAARITVDQPLDQLGMDSLMAIELSMRLEADLGLTVPNGTVMGTHSVSRLAVAVAALLAV
jgi:NAD(P)-dependent dehydrogenase (short-subunit alcohol dehydrogenase family)/acyl carrier protein